MATIQDIKQRFKNLQRMSDLRTEEFAEEGGLADSLAIELRDDLKPTQLRRIFSEVKRIRREIERVTRNEEQKQQAFERTRLIKLMPTMAYSVGRKLLPRDFYDILKLSFGQERLKTNADFLRATDFVEAVLAYHKYHSIN